ncbi:MAG TPA: MFS transporter [Rhizomicrobium sp.]|nr:MFS transporter [Rhizomicrobium sp.]
MSAAAVPGERAPKMTTWQKIVFGFGSVAFGVKDGGINTFLLVFYSQIVGISATLVSLAISIALFVDAFADPVIGTVSDHWRSKLGRRHPFMYASAVPVAVCYFLLWNPPAWSTGALFVYLLVVSIVLRVTVACYEIPSAALVAEISRDYDERTSVLAWRIFLQILIPAAVLMLTFAVFLANTKAHPNGILNRDGYFPYAILASAVMLVSILASSFGTRSRIPYLRKIGDDERSSIKGAARQTYEALTNKSFLLVTIAAIFASVASGVNNSLGTYFGVYFWKFTPPQLSALVTGGLLATVFALPLSPFLSRRYGKKKAGIALVAASLVIGNITPIMKLLYLLPPDGSNALLAIFFITTLLGTTCIIAGVVLLFSMITDVNEDNELRTGKRSEGVLAAANSFVGKTVSGVGILIAGILIDLVHFPAHATPQNLDPQIIRNLVLINTPLQFVLSAITITVLSFYKIDRTAHESNLKQLAGATAAGAEDAGPVIDTPKLG